ncbi:MAG: DNA mismatch repair protein MutS [Bacteroidetes bacterium HGW-Bacteroidetes-2]|jgi:DNA mismatch repair ATPase MutS|nr:MAG: DNA mismatch repair protein MutS [Bacteroidetes bacterium HGW-Bacteroidetes-2]
MTTTPFDFYTEQIDILKKQLKNSKQKLFASSMLRLALFLIICYGVYFYFGDAKMVIGVLIVGIALFLFLISRHSNISFHKKILQKLITLNKKEINALQRNVLDFPEGNEFEEHAHYFSQDIDLFGKGSFYQYVNRTATQEGSKTLAEKLKSNTINNIKSKQEIIKELSEKANWRQNFTAYASISKTETSTAEVVGLLRKHSFFVPKVMRVLPIIFSLLSIAVFTIYFMDLIGEMQLLLWFLIGLGITGFYLKNINELSLHASKIQDVFQQYQHLLLQIELANFTSEGLQSLQKKIAVTSKKASQIAKVFSKQLDALDQRNNILFGIFANGFLLWDLYQSFNLEQWMKEYSKKAEDWFEVIAEMDAMNSLATFAFNHPEYTFPEITSEKMILEATNFVHPLLDPAKAVTNNFKIENQQFFIITGANMAGKSTFLRSVSLGIVMANVGLPVCATSFCYSPIKLITSMRTTDSLTDDESYFFSELKRLKFIVDAITTDNYFIILDEILKGTNSTDKAIGSRKFIEKLVSSHSTGIIATHDLSLCEVAEELSDVKNYYFDAEIIEDELFFDYTIKTGVAKNMNASFLLKKMKIVD